MAIKRVIRVLPDGNEWVVRKDNASRVLVRRRTKNEALSYARNVAHNQHIGLVIHGKDGRIEKTERPSKDNQSQGEGCFITSACVNYYKLNDNCYQLRTLRQFRDSYLLQSSNGKFLVEQYYLLAPSLVLLLENDENKDMLFQNLFEQINQSCNAIENKDFKKAEMIYIKAIRQLCSHFNFRYDGY